MMVLESECQGFSIHMLIHSTRIFSMVMSNKNERPTLMNSKHVRGCPFELYNHGDIVDARLLIVHIAQLTFTAET